MNSVLHSSSMNPAMYAHMYGSILNQALSDSGNWNCAPTKPVIEPCWFHFHQVIQVKIRMCDPKNGFMLLSAEPYHKRGFFLGWLCNLLRKARTKENVASCVCGGEGEKRALAFFLQGPLRPSQIYRERITTKWGCLDLDSVLHPLSPAFVVWRKGRGIQEIGISSSNCKCELLS